MIENFEQRFDYIFSESGFNAFLKSYCKKSIDLSDDKIGIYSSMGIGSGESRQR